MDTNGAARAGDAPGAPAVGGIALEAAEQRDRSGLKPPVRVHPAAGHGHKVQVSGLGLWQGLRAADLEPRNPKTESKQCF